MTSTRFIFSSLLFALSFTGIQAQQKADKNPNLSYTAYSPKSTDLTMGSKFATDG